MSFQRIELRAVRISRILNNLNFLKKEKRQFTRANKFRGLWRQQQSTNLRIVAQTGARYQTVPWYLALTVASVTFEKNDETHFHQQQQHHRHGIQGHDMFYLPSVGSFMVQVSDTFHSHHHHL